ncbi:MAG: DUF5367 family protein [Bacteroidota bacterium]
MKSLNFKSAFIAALIVQVLGVSAFVASHFVQIMSDAELQANLALALTLIPAVTLGAHTYYRQGHQTNPAALGTAMFAIAIILDALITVPLLVIPAGGDHASFFGDPGFWIIGVLYVSIVVLYHKVRRALKSTKVTNA